MGYEIKKVPMADVASSDVGPITLSPRTYKMAATSTVKQGRVIEVVLPSDYKELYALPVLYLLHGGGEDHTAWRTKGQLIDALNGLQFPEKDQMQAMIIVTPDASSSTGYGNYGKAGDVFYTDLTVDIRKFVESNYKVDTARNARAISGFSMGAMQTHNLTLFYPGMFGFAYPICGGLYKSAGFSEAKMKSDIAGGVIDTALVHSMKAYKLHSNETDIAWTDTRDFEKYLTTVGVKHTYDFTSYSIGGHTFSYCNAVFKKYAIALFK
jgi:enterochelin esterase-like enzyme